MSKISNLLKGVDIVSVSEADLTPMAIQQKSIDFTKSISNFMKKLPNEKSQEFFMYQLIDDMNDLNKFNDVYSKATEERFGSK